MNNQISFQFSYPSFILGNKDKYGTYNEKDKNYLFVSFVGGFTLSNQPFLCFLVPDDDNSALANLIKLGAIRDFFATSPTNLQFKPDFRKTESGDICHGLLIKDANQIKKVTETERLPFSITFKVINQKKTKSETAGPNDYNHELEIEPLDLGIEGLPKITRLVFEFINFVQPIQGKPLIESKFYNSEILTESAGKTFKLDIKNLEINNKNKALNFWSDYHFDWNSFQEIKVEDNSHNSPTYNALKEKILRNLDKICLDPIGNFANSRALEKYWTWGDYYDSGEAKKNGQYKISDQNGEEVDLSEGARFEGESYWKFYKEIWAAIINNIKQSPTDWEIYSDGSDSQRGNYLKNKKTGVKHYKSGFTILIDKKDGEWDDEAGTKEWNEVEKIVKTPVPKPKKQGSQNEKGNKWYNPVDYPGTWMTVAFLSLFLLILVLIFVKKSKKKKKNI